MNVPTMLLYLNKTGKDVTQEATDGNPNFELCLETTRTFRGLGQSSENNITPQPSTHMTAQLFQTVSIEQI